MKLVLRYLLGGLMGYWLAVNLRPECRERFLVTFEENGIKTRIVMIDDYSIGKTNIFGTKETMTVEKLNDKVFPMEHFNHAN